MHIFDGLDVKERELPKLNTVSEMFQVERKDISTAAAVAEAMSDDHDAYCLSQEHIL